MSSFLRLQSQINKNQAVRPVIPKKSHVIRKNTDIFFALSFVLLSSILGVILIDYKQFTNEIIEGLLILFSLVMGILFIFWAYFKFTFPIDDKLSKLNKLSLKKALPAGFIVGVLFLEIWINMFSLYIPNQIQNQFSFPLYIFAIFLITSCIVIDLGRTASPKTQNLLYIHKFLIQKLQQWDPKYTSVYTNFLALLGIIIIIPLLLIYIDTQNIVLTIFIWFNIIGILYFGYWSGYSFYRSFRWIQGYNNDIKLSLAKQVGLVHFASIVVAIGSIFWLIIYGSIIFLIQTKFLVLDTFSSLIISFITLTILINTSVQSSTRVTNTQPDYSFLFPLFQLGIITILSVTLFELVKPTIIISWIINIFNSSNNINILFFACYWIGILLLFRTNSSHVRLLIYKDDFESGQMISEINLTLNQLKSVDLTLLAKIGRYQNNNNTMFKLLGVYEYIFENNLTNDIVLETMYPFLLYELETANDWRIHSICFDLVYHFLQVKLLSYFAFYEKSLKTIRHKNEMVRQASLNLLGHIVNIDPNLADEVFPLIFEVFEAADEQFKKIDIEPMKYYAKHFPQYREKLFTFITNKIDKEFFGVSTELMKVLQEIANVDDDYTPKILNFSKEILSKPDSHGGLGAIRIILDHFPKEPSEGVPIIKLLINNLRQEESEIKQHIIYALGTIFGQIPELTPLLREIDFAMDDDDANVRSALIQVISELYPSRSIPQEALITYMKMGITDNDYVVRLMAIQAIGTLVTQEPTLFDILPEILEKLLNDSNTDVQETALHVYERNYIRLKDNFPNFVEKIAIDIDQMASHSTKRETKLIFKENIVEKPEY